MITSFITEKELEASAILDPPIWMIKCIPFYLKLV